MHAADVSGVGESGGVLADSVRPAAEGPRSEAAVAGDSSPARDDGNVVVEPPDRRNKTIRSHFADSIYERRRRCRPVLSHHSRALYRQ